MANPAESERLQYQTPDQTRKPSPLRNPPEIRRFPRGIDLINGVNRQHDNNNGVIYEEQCFEDYTMQLPNNQVAIGPHLLDRAIALGGVPLIQFARPDSLKFQLEHGSLELVEMAEFKSRKKNGITALKDKISAFPDLLDYLRLRPGLLAQLLNDATNDNIDIRNIIIPPNADIKVLVVSAHLYPISPSVFPFDTRFEYSQLKPIPSFH